MIRAFLAAIGQLGDPRILRVLGLTVVLSIAVFAALWTGVGFLLTHTRIFETAWLDTAIDVLGGLATLLVSWFLFPGVVSAVLCAFLEPVAAAVEARHYPRLGKAPGLGFAASLAASLRFLLVTVVLNLLLLAVLVVPPAFPFAFYGVNGYLLGREYFELVALRRQDAQAARALRRGHGTACFLFGVVVALLLTVPFVNLLVPVLATAAAVHLWCRWSGAG
jgi:uncharacterized protein involved in cysteine biosynthesis